MKGYGRTIGNSAANVKTTLSVLFATLALVVPATAASGQSEAALKHTIERYQHEVSQKPNDAQALFRLGQALHDISNLYGVQDGTEAVRYLQESYDLDPTAITLAYLGSAWTLAGRDAKNPLTKINDVLKGTGLLDDAVKKAPDDVIVRRIRLENSYALPDIFQRKAIAEKDADFLLHLYLKDPHAFDGKYDPAYVFLFKARLLAFDNKLQSAVEYARLGAKIATDPVVVGLLNQFLQGKDTNQ